MAANAFLNHTTPHHTTAVLFVALCSPFLPSFSRCSFLTPRVIEMKWKI